jgi:hypothetical protein
MGSTWQLFIGERGRADVGPHPYPHLQPNQRSSRVCYEFGSVFITPRFHFFTPKSSRFAGLRPSRHGHWVRMMGCPGGSVHDGSLEWPAGSMAQRVGEHPR